MSWCRYYLHSIALGGIDPSVSPPTHHHTLGCRYDPRRACAEKSAAQHTKFSRSYLKAAELLHDAVAAAERCPYNRTMRGGGSDPPDEVHSDPHNLHACCCLLKAFMLTDFRLQIETTILRLLPGSPLVSHITIDCMASDAAVRDEMGLERGQPMLLNMSVAHLVVILCDGMRSMFAGSRGR